MATSNNGTATVAEYVPFFRYKNVATKDWTTTGNSDTVTDPKVSSNSIILIQNLDPRNGLWYISSQTAGTGFVVTSSDSESAGTTYSYIIL